MEGSWRWFRDVVGLPAQGLLPSPNMGKIYASKKECEKLWGKRKSNNGFRYNTHDDESLKTRIETLIRQVYQRKQTPNSDINLTFAMGVIAERKGFKINWAKYAEYVHRRKRSFSPLPEYRSSSSSHDMEKEEEEEEDDDEEEKDEEEKEKDGSADGNGQHKGNSTEACQGEGIPPTVDHFVEGEQLMQPQPKSHGCSDGDQLQSPRQGVVHTDAPKDHTGDERLGTERGGEEVGTQFELKTPQKTVEPAGETHGAGLGHSHVAAVGENSATPPLVSEGLQMPPTLGKEIDDNGLSIMERAVRLKEVQLREEQVKFKRELLQFKIGQLALKRKYLHLGSPGFVVEEEKNKRVGEGSKFGGSSLATQVKDINLLVVKKRQTVKDCAELLEAMQKKLVDLLFKMNSAEGRLHSAKVQVLGLENIDGNDVHKFGLAEVQDAILELEKVCHEIGEARCDLKTKMDHHKSELTKLHHYEACLDRLKQNKCRNGSPRRFFLNLSLRVLHCS
jgi:hypothetical protein